MSEHAIDNAKAWYDEIRELVTIYETAARYAAREAAALRIKESPLSVLVRSGWFAPGSPNTTGRQPSEYKILLSTGGPALRIVGELDQYGEPASAFMEWQDWGTPWTPLNHSDIMSKLEPDDDDGDWRDVLVSFASHFYFGE